MKRWISNLGAATALLMCIAVAAIWICSLLRFDDLCWTTPTSCINVVSVHGKLHVQVARATAPVWSHGQQWDTAFSRSVGYNPGPYRWQVLGFAKGFRANRLGRASTAEDVYVVPYWFMLVGAAVLLALCLKQVHRRRIVRWRAAHGLCLHCGYDLRASSGRCPECGSVPGQELKGTIV